MGFFYSGGGERTVINEALELCRCGHDVRVFAPIIRSDNCFPELIQKIDVKGFFPKIPIPIPLREALSMIASSASIPVLARRFGEYDAFICHGQPSTWMGYVIRRVLKKPFICYLHQPNRFLYPRPIDIQVGWRTNPSLRALNFLITKMGKGLIKELDMLSVVEANALLTNSKWMAKSIERIYHKTPIVCYPGVDTGLIDLASSEVGSLPNNQKLRRPFILSTGRHYPQKRLDLLIEMMPIILSKCPNATLALTSRFTTYTSTLMKLCEDFGVKEQVVFTGEVDERILTQLYATASVYAHTAPEEDLGLGPLEAGACKTPSVVWGYAGPVETVIDGITGYHAKPYSLVDFAEKTSEILMDETLRNKLGLNAYQHVQSNFTWEKHTDKLESILASVI